MSGSTTITNPLLLNPTATTPDAVVPIARGTTPPSPVVLLDVVKHYILEGLNASMHTTDGTPLRFVEKYLSTKYEHQQQYLDDEIKRGHPYLRYATDVEIQAAEIRADPMGTMRTQVARELESSLREELERKIRAEFAAGHVTPDAVKVAGTTSALDKLTADVRSGSGSLKLGGIVSTADIAPVAGNSTAAGAATATATKAG